MEQKGNEKKSPQIVMFEVISGNFLTQLPGLASFRPRLCPKNFSTKNLSWEELKIVIRFTWTPKNFFIALVVKGIRHVLIENQVLDSLLSGLKLVTSIAGN